MSQEEIDAAQAEERERRRLRLVRLHTRLSFLGRIVERLPGGLIVRAVGLAIVAIVVMRFTGLDIVLNYTPGPTAVFRFFFPVKHGCSQNYDFKEHRMVWADDGSPADPPLPGYRWDVYKCEWQPTQQFWMRH